MNWRQINPPIIEKADSAASVISVEMDLFGATMAENDKIQQKVSELFVLLKMPVYKYLIAVFGDSAEAEDWMQAAFLQLYKALRSGQTILNVKFWLYRVAHNAAISHHRHQQFIAPLNADSWEEIERVFEDKNLNPEQQVLLREKYERIYEAMKRLSLQERQALHLRAEGFKYKEIAEIMNVAIPTVNEFLRRGIRKLTEQK